MGKKIARKTLNPRLGIVGGISILGTRGTVKPFSNKAYKDTITLSMDVMKVAGGSTIALTTGGRSERFLKEKIPFSSGYRLCSGGGFFLIFPERSGRKGIYGYPLYVLFR